MTDFETLLREYRNQIIKTLEHLAYSYGKVQHLTASIDQLSSEDLETWEGFVSRFARASDIFLAKYLRTRVLQGDPAFRGSLRDFVDQAEKMGVIDNADEWMGIRELRNLSTHEYTTEGLSKHFENLRKLAPKILGLKAKI